MEPLELGWLAGLLEGEGSFMWQPGSGRNRGRIKIQVSMTDQDTVQMAAALMGGNSVYREPDRRENHSTCYRTHLQGKRAAALCRTLLPLMSQRRSSRIEELLKAYGESLNQPIGWRPTFQNRAKAGK